MPTARVRDLELHYVRAGEGEPLLMIQGLSGNHRHWGEEFPALLARRFDTIAFDNRGAGLSDRPDGPFTIADLAADAAGLLDALEVERAHVLGISMGGMIAQELALGHPGRVATLTLGCTSPGGAAATHPDPEVIQTLSSLYLAGRREEALRAGWRFNVSEPFAEANNALFKSLIVRVAEELPIPVEMMLMQLQAALGHDAAGRLGEVAAPTLIVHGSEDRMLPVANARALAQRIEHARLEIIEGVGHLFWLERPRRAGALIEELAREAQPAA